MGAVTLEQIGRDAVANPYPARVLDGCRSALILFGAGFLGRQDGWQIAHAGLTATVVDVRGDLLRQMRVLYPIDWRFVDDDVYRFLGSAAGTWDVVSVDSPTSHFDRCARLLPSLCALAERTVVLGTGRRTAVDAPAGWEHVETVHRSEFAGGVDWKVLERR